MEEHIRFKSKKDVNIGIIGKYVNLKDAYKSLDEALIHEGISNNFKVNLKKWFRKPKTRKH